MLADVQSGVCTVLQVPKIAKLRLDADRLTTLERLGDFVNRLRNQLCVGFSYQTIARPCVCALQKPDRPSGT